MATAHIESRKEDIGEIVLLPGDPLRAKYIAENFLEDYKLVNSVRNMYAYTGYYKGKMVTVFSSGMGIPSVGIYAYELFKFYDVKKIIRIGTCGTIHKDVKLLDVVLADSAYSVSTFPLLFDGDTDKEHPASSLLNNLISNINSLYRESLNGKCPFDLIKDIIPLDILKKIGLHYIDAEKVNLTPSLLGQKNIENIKNYLDKSEIKKAHINL